MTQCCFLLPLLPTPPLFVSKIWPTPATEHLLGLLFSLLSAETMLGHLHHIVILGPCLIVPRLHILKQRLVTQSQFLLQQQRVA